MLIEAGVVAATTGVITAIYRWKREKIRADRDVALADLELALARLALKDSQPGDRVQIIEKLAKTKHFGHFPLPPHIGDTDDDEAG